MRINIFLKLMLLAASLGSGCVAAETTSIGFVKRVEGEAKIISAQDAIQAQPGTPIHLGDRIKTGENGRLGVTFKDNTIMSFGPETEVVMDEYLFDPAEGQLKLALNMLKGTLHYISGVIAKLKPEAVSVKTPAGIIGVRGTRFLVKSEAE